VTVQHVTNIELTTDKDKQQCKDYNHRVKDILSNANHIIPQGNNIALQDWNDFPVEEDPELIEEFQRAVSHESIPAADDTFTPDIFNDTYLNMEVTLPRGRTLKRTCSTLERS
jgi:hypothetical protein